ncbi:MAG: RecQ family ATP-dependent DNA helicase, partial [Lachnospiraceae bacterium]|nr:RecQ family ATP-dependent DNA helicase [Lachnospiraceae bacterium]
AHCISQWGQDFRPSYLKIVQFVKHLPKRPVISAFTATATERVKDDIACVLGLVKPQILITGFDRKNLYFAVETLGRQREKDAYVLDYIKNHPDESGVVYCATRKKVEEVCGLLLEAGVPAAKYHAGLGNEERRQSQEDFTYDKTAVMVATNAFGMGIDKSNIRYVIHYNMPQSMENYYQEAGRAGRDGGAAECILLYSAQDMMINRFLLEEGAEEVREQDEMRLRRMQGYCMTKNCLREYILSYFGEYGTKACGNCSNCQGEFEEVDVTAEAKKIIYCIREMGQRYGINVVVGTLLGAGTAKLREYNVARYSMYGNLKGWPEADVREIMSLLLEEGFLVQTKDKYALLKLTEQAVEWMEGGKNIILKRAKKTHGDRVENPERISGGRKSDILNSKGLELFELLRQLRMEIAREENVPPYVVFADKTLM